MQNRYSFTDRPSDDLVDRCAAEQIAYGPLGAQPFEREAPLARGSSALQRVARRHGASPAQVALAWLLVRSAALLPIAGTTSTHHLEANVAAAQLTLTHEDLVELADEQR